MLCGRGCESWCQESNTPSFSKPKQKLCAAQGTPRLLRPTSAFCVLADRQTLLESREAGVLLWGKWLTASVANICTFERNEIRGSLCSIF